jgi:hypothetical protein
LSAGTGRLSSSPGPQDTHTRRTARERPFDGDRNGSQECTDSGLAVSVVTHGLFWLIVLIECRELRAAWVRAWRGDHARSRPGLWLVVTRRGATPVKAPRRTQHGNFPARVQACDCMVRTHGAVLMDTASFPRPRRAAAKPHALEWGRGARFQHGFRIRCLQPLTDQRSFAA